MYIKHNISHAICITQLYTQKCGIKLKKFTSASLPIFIMYHTPIVGEAQAFIRSQSSLGIHPGTPCILQVICSRKKTL